MRVVHARCCGLDVHKKTVVAGVRLTGDDGSVQRQVRTFGTVTAELLALSDWLDQLEVTQVALESTGVYWRPVFNLLEEGSPHRTVVLVNPQHLQHVPGRKTDVLDAEWLADLLRHGLVRASFLPPAPIRALRELTRSRKTLVRTRADEVNRLQKVLESANLKLASVATDVLGLSGREILRALVAGERDPETLAELARGKLRAKLPALRQALQGRVQAHHVVLLGHLLAHIEFLEEAIAELEAEIARHLAAASPPVTAAGAAASPPVTAAGAAPAGAAPAGALALDEAVALLQTIPGVGQTVATAIVAEIGTDMTRFPSAKHLASWAGVCPGNKASGGKRLSGATTKGNVWLRAMLGEAARSAARTKGTYLAAQYRRLAHRRGPQKAAVAVAHRLLPIAYYVLRERQPYRELGPDHFVRLDQRATARHARHLVRQLHHLGYTVTPPQAAPPAPASSASPEHR